MSQHVILEVKLPRSGEETPESMAHFMASLTSIKTKAAMFKSVKSPFSFEILLYDQTIHFCLVTSPEYQSFLESQLISQYPKASITPVKEDYVTNLLRTGISYEAGQMELQYNHLYPLRTYKDFTDIDPMSSLLGMLSKLNREDTVLIQFLMVPVSSSWQSKGQGKIEASSQNKNAEQPVEDPLKVNIYKKQIAEKVAYPGLRVGIRIFTQSPNAQLLDLVAATFTSFNSPAGNSLKLARPFFWQRKGLMKALIERTDDYIPTSQVLNVLEIATMFHFPGTKLSTISGLTWAKTILSESPENLPISQDIPEEEKVQINFFARTDFKNRSTIFGIKKNDRRRHIYIIGKTGTGKSTLIANMAINDMRNREGFAVIDPHGDLCEVLLDYVPSYRINDVVYLNPADTDFPFHLNPLEIDNLSQKELVTSGIVSIFNKLYAHSWGPRLEYILRNCLLTLAEVPNATLVMIPDLLTNKNFRQKVVSKLNDPVLKNFWLNEFEKMSPQLMNESASPILNKVGQFVSSPLIRNIIGHPKSTINLERIMNEGKILILNLSQGRLGEDNSALLGAMIITKLQLAAMNRVAIPEEQRRDFYLYVDEFQNFATTSFIKILSEARKYRLNLVLANQYTAQVREDVRSAIFGNTGTLMSFLIGAEDAPILAREFGERFKVEDLLSLNNFNMLIKMAIDGSTSAPFLAQSLQLPMSKTQNRDKVIRSSRERYTRGIRALEELPAANATPTLPQLPSEVNSSMDTTTIDFQGSN